MSWERVAIGIAVVAAVAVLLVLLWPVARHRLIYPGGTLAPDRSDPALHGLPHGEEVWLQAEDGVRVHAWWVPARPATNAAIGDPAGEQGAVIYFHGNAETMATRAWIADRLSRLGYHALLFDYRGYGLSEGRASEEGLARDARAAWRQVVEERGVSPDRVVLMGHSLGSAVATRLALELEGALEVAAPPAADADARSRPGSGAVRLGTDGSVSRAPAALIVGSPFPDMPTLFGHHAPWLPGLALRWGADRHAAGSRLADVVVPVLVIIGSRDQVIPPALSREVAEPFAGATVVTVAADHATVMGHPEVWDRARSFLQDVLAD